MDDTLVFPGGALKHVGDGRVTGLLVRFSTAADPDVSPSRDFFTKNTDYGFDGGTEITTPIYYDHGKDGTIGKERLGRGTLKMMDEGIWIDAQLDKRKKYAKAVLQLADMGVLGWSSGSVPHLVEKKAVDGTPAHEVVRWPLGADGTLTPTPAEPRTQAVALKSVGADEYPTFKSLCEQKGIDIDSEPAAAEEPTGKTGAVTEVLTVGDPAATTGTLSIYTNTAKGAQLRLQIDGTRAVEFPVSALIEHADIKGAFNEAYAQQMAQRDYWELTDSLSSASRKITEDFTEGKLTAAGFEDEAATMLDEFAAAYMQNLRAAMPRYGKSVEAEGLPGGLRLGDAQTQLLAAADELTARWSDLVAKNRPAATDGEDGAVKTGAAISAARRERLQALRDQIALNVAKLDELLAETEPKPAEAPADVLADGGKSASEADIIRELARFEQIRAAAVVMP